MYVAICVMLAGILIGRLTRNLEIFGLCRFLNLPAMLLLLFLLGVGIGKNRLIIEALPLLGGKALLLTLFGMAGSVACVACLKPLLEKSVKREKR